MESLHQKLANRIGLGQFDRIVRLLGMLVDEQEIKMLFALPGDALIVAEKLGLPPEEVESALRTLFVKGMAFPSLNTVPRLYNIVRSPVQFHDSTILWPEAPREFLDLWQEFMEEDGYEVFKLVADVLPRPVMRVIPVNVTVPNQNQILAFEDVRLAVENAEVLAVTKCTCKLTAGKCDTTLECCLQLNKAALYAIERGTGREMTKAEAIELMKTAEKEGLIHTVNNLKSMHTVICNCCSCCCQNFPGMLKYNIQTVDPSRFIAEVDPDLCTGCESCLESCYFDALAMVGATAEVVNADKCTGCGLCLVNCADEAIRLKATREPDFIPDVSMVH